VKSVIKNIKLSIFPRFTAAIILLFTLLIIVTQTPFIVAGGYLGGVEYTWQYYRPLIGGIQILVYIEDPTAVIRRGYCTLGYPVERGLFTRGVITAGHCSLFYYSPENITYSRIHVYQPRYSYFYPYYYIGNPSFVNLSADVMFIPYSNISPVLLFYTGWQLRQVPIADYVPWDTLKFLFESGLLREDTPIYKTGRSTGSTWGYILRFYDYITISGRDWRNQTVDFKAYYVIYSDLPSYFGDSGSPVFFFWGDDPRTASEATLIGHAVAINTANNYTYITSVSAVIYSGFRPRTINP
jgi:hypothetical protein